MFQSGDHYIRIEGFDMTLAQRGITINASNHDIYMLNNKFHRLGKLQTTTVSGQSGIYSGQYTYNITIDSNHFEKIGRDGTSTNHDHGVYLGGSPLGASDVLIKNNVFINRSSGWPIHIFTSGGGIFSNITIINNTFDQPNTTKDGQIILAADIDNLLIQNNIFSDPKGVAIKNSHGCENIDVTLHNNITNVTSLIDNACNFTMSGNLTRTDPMFIDANNRDYRLRSNSPAVDIGLSVNAPLTDYYGNSRPQGKGIDIGAYEGGTLLPSTCTLDSNLRRVF